MVSVYPFEVELCTGWRTFSARPIAGRPAPGQGTLGEPGRLGASPLVCEEGTGGRLGVEPTVEGHELDDPLPVRGRDAGVHHLLRRLGGDGAEAVQVEDVERDAAPLAGRRLTLQLVEGLLRRGQLGTGRADGGVEGGVREVERGVVLHGLSIPFLLRTLHRVENFFSDVRSDLRQEVGERRGIVVLEGDREARPEHDPRRVRQRTFLHLDAVLAGGVCVDDRELLDVIHGPSIPFPL